MLASGHPGATAFDSPGPSLSSRVLEALQEAVSCHGPGWREIITPLHPSCVWTLGGELNMTDSASTLRAQTTVSMFMSNRQTASLKVL